jgi:hypothetical protein
MNRTLPFGGTLPWGAGHPAEASVPPLPIPSDPGYAETVDDTLRLSLGAGHPP